jgi:hypothetical protein
MITFDSAFAQEARKPDNYTVQYLIVKNDNNEILMMKNQAGWHTLAMRSTANQSIKEALDSLAGTIGISIESPKLAGLYTYKFEGLPDHKQVSFRTHFTARYKGGEVVQPQDANREYHWVAIPDAMSRITFESLKLETSQILKHPQQVWGGSFLITWKGDKFIGSKVVEEPYPLM